MIQKIIASIMMFVLLSTSIANAYTPEDQMNAQASLWEYSKYTSLLEEALPQISLEKLTKLQETIQSTPANAVTDDKGGNIWDFLKYTLISIDLELKAREALFLQEVVNEQESQMIKEEIMSLQSNLKTETLWLFESIVIWWEELSSYEEAWNLKMIFDMAIQDEMQLEWDFKISDYISQTHVFDQTFSGNIETNYELIVPGNYGGEIDFSLSTDADIIAKDGSIYVKLDNLNAQSQSSHEYLEFDVAPYTKRIIQLAKDNTYLELPAQELSYYLSWFNYKEMPQQMREQIQDAFSEPLLKAQYKTDNGYTLIPTKHFCDMGKRISKVFDPFGGEDCSEGQYQDWLQEFHQSDVNILLSLDTENTLSISLTEDDESVDIDLSWDETSITKIEGHFVNTRSEYRGDKHADFLFIPKDSFTASAGDNHFDTSLSLGIDRNGKIYSGNYSLETDDNLEIQWVYANKTLSIDAQWGDEETYFTCSFDGPLKKDFINISWECNIHASDISYELPGVQDVTIKSALSYNGEGSKNNLDFSFYGFVNDKNYIDLKVSNIGTRRSIQIKNVIAPKSTKDIDQFFDEIYEEIYSDYYSDYDYGYEDYDYEDYEYISNEYDDYSEDCYVYESWDSTCYKYYDDKDETCYYTAETDELECEEYVYADWEYEVEEYTFDDHTTTCYLYGSGDTTCYEYYDDRSNTCEYIAETDKTECEEYDYGYTYEETETDEYSQTCYYYDGGDYTCYTYYDDKDETCYYTAEIDELECEEYEYSNYYDDEYYDDYNYEDAKEVIGEATDAVETIKD